MNKNLIQPDFLPLSSLPSEPELTVLSFGGGQDSTDILLRLHYDAQFRKTYAPKKLIVIMADTGDEHRTNDAVRLINDGSYVMTDENVALTKSFCAEHGIEFYHITPDMGYHRDGWHSLQQQYDLNQTVGSKVFRKSCTDNLKIKPIYGFLAHYVQSHYQLENLQKKYRSKAPLVAFAQAYGKISILIGIAANETSRVAPPQNGRSWMDLSINRVYPLIDIGATRSDCQKNIESLGHKIPYPSNCRRCPYMSDVELLWLFLFDRETFDDWVRQEQAKFKKYAGKVTKNLGVWGEEKGCIPTLLDKLADSLEKYKEWTPAMIDEYKKSHGHCVKSKY